MIDSVAVAVLQYALEVPPGKIVEMAPAQGGALRSEAARLLESGLLEQPCREHRFIVGRCIFEELLARLAAGSKISEHFGDQLSQSRLVEHRPRHGSLRCAQPAS